MELLIAPITAANNAAKGLASLPTTDGEVGRGELNNAATWDEFPNGRFGDFKSPAYGNQGLWGSPVISVGPSRCTHFALTRTVVFRSVTQ